jgi:hypothetical protein
MNIKSDESRKNELHFRFSFDKEDIKLEYSLIGVVVHLKDCITAGEPGGPALPKRVVNVAIPQGMRVGSIEGKAVQQETLTAEMLPIAPLQPLRAGQDRKRPAYQRPLEEQRKYRYKEPEKGDR